MSLQGVGYVFGLLWFISGLLVLQTTLIARDDLQSPPAPSAAVLQDRHITQPAEPNGRPQNSNLSAPVRAILTPAYYTANKALPFGSDGVFFIASGSISLALFILAVLQVLKRNLTFQRHNLKLRARAPPAYIFA